VRSPDVRVYLNAIKDDQGAMLQLSPESMDLMVAGFEDRPGVAYQSTASMSPGPTPTKWLSSLLEPWQTVSLALFAALHAITASFDERYPCGAIPADPRGEGRPPSGAEGSRGTDATEAVLQRAFGASPDLHANDGCVPIRSQLWGQVVWAGLADHLDVLGHYHDETPEKRPELRHNDWLKSGSRFDDAQFESLMDAVASGMLGAVS